MRVPDIAPALLCAILLLHGCGNTSTQPEKTAASETKKGEAFSLEPYLKEAAQQSTGSNDYAAAATHWGALYDEDPSNIQTAVNFAANLRYAGGPREAIFLLDRALAAHPDEPLLLAQRGKAYAAAGELEPALADIGRALHSQTGDWSLYSAQGVIFDRQGRQAEAEAAYKKALAISPGNPKVLNNMALSIALSGRLDGAIGLLRQAVQHPEATIQVRQNLSLLLALSGDVQTASEIARADLPAAISANNIAYFQSLNETK